MRKELKLRSQLFRFLGLLTENMDWSLEIYTNMNSRITSPNFCFDHIYDSNKKNPVSLHLATFKQGRKGSSSKRLLTPPKCIWMQVFSASVLYNRRKTTDHTQQLGLRPSRTIWNIYRQKENFKGAGIKRLRKIIAEFPWDWFKFTQ